MLDRSPRRSVATFRDFVGGASVNIIVRRPDQRIHGRRIRITEAPRRGNWDGSIPREAVRTSTWDHTAQKKDARLSKPIDTRSRQERGRPDSAEATRGRVYWRFKADCKRCRCVLHNSVDSGTRQSPHQDGFRRRSCDKALPTSDCRSHRSGSRFMAVQTVVGKHRNGLPVCS